MTKRDRAVCLAAALLIVQTAVVLRECHTVKGKWPKGEKEVRRDYGRMLLVARRLCQMVTRRKKA